MPAGARRRRFAGIRGAGGARLGYGLHHSRTRSHAADLDAFIEEGLADEPIYVIVDTAVAAIVGAVLASPLVGELLIVNDYSTDGTGKVLDALDALDDPRVRVIHDEVNQGKGSALRTGFAAATLPYASATTAEPTRRARRSDGATVSGRCP